MCAYKLMGYMNVKKSVEEYTRLSITVSWVGNGEGGVLVGEERGEICQEKEKDSVFTDGMLSKCRSRKLSTQHSVKVLT